MNLLRLFFQENVHKSHFRLRPKESPTNTSNYGKAKRPRARWPRSLGRAIKKECPTGMFQCNNGECIHSRRICDGNSNCPDKEDERLCCEFKSLNFYVMRVWSFCCLIRYPCNFVRTMMDMVVYQQAAALTITFAVGINAIPNILAAIIAWNQNINVKLVSFCRL